ncbi:sugar kinase [Photobacterium kishitanii]|uniref:2-dehydro-3-deoxygluconokinase n=1 Tax=Photobacterium kishitanii TaxID=318456 RepID=A0A0B7JJG4_9GAMM|nr:sugar kinase [Photobacterium kishitanii]PSU91602.1 sugar kinase [Photobacterium kishitanii]PSU95405.1 sugar kinase [Photobacterium kishitanii]CEO41537.1 2-dehydro-3-deoxygluconokinase [Photobacterium kishitanii]
MKRIALIGECMIELNGSSFGAMQQTYGGDSLNTAVYLARIAGQSVAIDYISALGCDAISDGMIMRWQQEGINTATVLRDKHRQPGLYLIQLDEFGERTFLYWRDQSAARYMLRHSEFERVVKHLDGVDMVYLSGISLAILPPDDRQQLIDLLTRLSKKGVSIIFDSNYRPALWEDSETTRHCYRQLFAITDLALVTNDDEAALWGDTSEEETLLRLKQTGVKQAVVKMGPKGNYYENFMMDIRTFVAATVVKNVVDTTSAGDSFNAGFIAGVIRGLSPVKCSELGHQLAGIVIQHKGAIIPASETAEINCNNDQTTTNIFNQYINKEIV